MGSSVKNVSMFHAGVFYYDSKPPASTNVAADVSGTVRLSKPNGESASTSAATSAVTSASSALVPNGKAKIDSETKTATKLNANIAAVPSTDRVSLMTVNLWRPNRAPMIAANESPQVIANHHVAEI